MKRLRLEHEMAIAPCGSRRTIRLARMFVFGCFHRLMCVTYERDCEGDWRPAGPWFNTMAEGVVWAFAEGQLIDNWSECETLLETEAEERRQAEECLRSWRESCKKFA